MQAKKSLNANLTLKRLKKALQINTDIELSKLLNIKPNTISTWKKRDTLDYNAIISICNLYEIDLNKILSENPKKNEIGNIVLNNTPLIKREIQFEYCLGNEDLLNSLPKYHFPFIQSKISRAFEIVSNNMKPTINANSFVVCEITDIKTIEENAIVVIISKTKGLIINRVINNSPLENNFTISNDNTFFRNTTIDPEDIKEIWAVKNILIRI
ncbi:helix-turn-helix domain-containing protein [Flavobacterium sp. ALJ2]|uniref:LexA family transcriptional regulator n=1 Tax=Flavobacterium sp. ALJ2 TaxID=2786960 RepID=UPI00189E4F97|nr:helix-turn-helix domain-containing protein [Flavobacterium sp. ALJ2]MBF7093251.1 helix-turn-helix domain-containing protein [Flavobacterium sp. ALJ2]